VKIWNTYGTLMERIEYYLCQNTALWPAIVDFTLNGRVSWNGWSMCAVPKRFSNENRGRFCWSLIYK